MPAVRVNLWSVLNEKEQEKFNKQNLKCREAVFGFHNQGYGNVGAVGGHLIPDYKTVINKGFKFIYNKAKTAYENLSEKESDRENANARLEGAESTALAAFEETDRAHGGFGHTGTH